MHKADSFNKTTKSDLNEVLCNQLVQNIKMDEFLKTVKQVDTVNYANQRMVNTLFTYKLKDDIDNIDIANDCCREYNQHKFTGLPNGMMPNKRKFK